jgi:hypothetical protein
VLVFVLYQLTIPRGILFFVANKKFGFSSKQTLDLAQSLYEKHKAVTYPRSDCQYLPISQLSEVKNVMTAISSIDSNLSELECNKSGGTFFLCVVKFSTTAWLLFKIFSVIFFAYCSLIHLPSTSIALSLMAQKKGYRGVLSVGRVQTPTLAIVVNRDIEIENFKPKDYYALARARPAAYKGLVSEPCFKLFNAF